MSVHDDGIGPTHQVPSGKLYKGDQGGLQYAVGADLAKNRVVVQFGTPVAWLGLTKEQTIRLAQGLLEKAGELTD